ncbi:hypothetical protein GF319_09295, partial [Candidatus Bathyarchaeota archaeon]|nr:hypothetical protein [Candidatus Bathyarchaeota archaeon]
MKKKLIAIDVEGVIIPKAMYLIKIFLRYRPGKLLNVLWAGSLYSLGLIPIDRALVEIFRHLEGLEEEKLLIIIRDIDLKPGVVELFEEIRDRGHKIVLITSGIPQQALDLIASSLKVDHAVGPHVIIKDGRVTGQVTGALVEEGGKSEVLRLIIEENNLEDYSIVSIADDKNNITLFKMSDLSIGYRPDFMLTLYSDRIAKGNLGELMSIIEGKEVKKHRPKPSTILRKAVHTSAIFIPLILIEYLGSRLIAFLLILTTLAYFGSEVIRYLGKDVPLISWFTQANTLEIEATEYVDAPIYFALGIAISLLIFPEHIASASITVLALGDPSASIIGKTLGKHQLPLANDKTIEGLIAFIIASFLGCLLFLNPAESIICSISGAIAEALPTPLNDNLVIPLFSGLI